MSLAAAYRMKKKCMSKGGKIKAHPEVKDTNMHEKGVHYANYVGPGNSPAGSFAKAAHKGNTSLPKDALIGFAKDEHKRRLAELKAMPNPKLYAHGGMLTDDGYQSSCDAHCNYPCDVHMGDQEGYAGGGTIHAIQRGHEFKGINKPPPAARTSGTSYAGLMVRQGHLDDAKEFHKAVSREKRDYPHGPTTGKSGFAKGGVVDRVMAKRGHFEDTYMREAPTHGKGWQPGVHNAPDHRRPGESDMGRALRGRKGYGSEYTIAKDDVEMKREQLRRMKGPHGNYSEGGQVANTDELTAGFEPNEFDDLHLRDDLDFEYTGANSGDELGNEGEDERRRDIVSRIMRSRAKRPGHNPRPA